MILEILIPTHNRAADLERNLWQLHQSLVNARLSDSVGIIVSDNCSSDDTAANVDRFLRQKSRRVAVRYHRNASNVGLEKNAIQCLSLARADFVLYLGDDDFLDPDYLAYCVEKITSVPDLGCIISAKVELGRTPDERTPRSISQEKLVGPGFDAVWQYSHLAHQMSGLTLRRGELLEQYLTHDQWRNIYLFIYFAANRMTQYQLIYAPQFRTQVTTTNAKDWEYNELGLLDEVYKSYYPFAEAYGMEGVARLLVRFTVMHSYRLGIDCRRPVALLRKYSALCKAADHVRGFRLLLGRAMLKDYVRSIVARAN